MATYILMLGSAIAVAAAGQVSVKQAERPPEDEEKKQGSSAFWSGEVARIKQEDNYVEDCKGAWSAWSACDEECDGGTQTREFTKESDPKNGGKPCPDPTKETRACNTQKCTGAPPLSSDDANFKGYKPVMKGKRCQRSDRFISNDYVRKPGESKVQEDDVLSWKYQRLLERGIEKCNNSKFCQYVELQHKNSIAKTFTKGDCEKTVDDPGSKIWEKIEWNDPYVQDPIHGYEQFGSRHPHTKQYGMCGIKDAKSMYDKTFLDQGHVPGSRVGGKGSAPAFTVGGFSKADPVYSAYVESAAQICNADPNCKYVSVWKNGTYRTFGADACEKTPLFYQMADVKTWEKKDPSVAGLPPWNPTKDGYRTVGEGTCEGEPMYQSKQAKTEADNFSDRLYLNYAKEAAKKCEETENCKFATVMKDSTFALFDFDNCDSKTKGTGRDKTWTNKRVKPPPPPPPPPPPGPPPSPPPPPIPGPKLPFFNCDRNRSIPLVKKMDGNCDCEDPGTWNDEHENVGKAVYDALPESKRFKVEGLAQPYFKKTGACDAANFTPRKAYEINTSLGVWTQKFDRGTRYLQGRPVIVRKDKSGWESRDFDLGSEFGMGTFGSGGASGFGVGYSTSEAIKYADKCAEKKEELYRELQRTKTRAFKPVGMSVWRTADQWKCRVYTHNNGEGTDPVCTDTPWAKKSCVTKAPDARSVDNDDEENQWSGGGLYWMRSIPVGGLMLERDGEWGPPPPPPPPPPKSWDTVTTNSYCGKKAKPKGARCPDNHCCTWDSNLCVSRGTACSTTGVAKDVANYHGKRTKYWSPPPPPPPPPPPTSWWATPPSRPPPPPPPGAPPPQTGWASFLPKATTTHTSTNYSCGPQGTPKKSLQESMGASCKENDTCCGDMNGFDFMCVQSNLKEIACSKGHHNRNFDHPNFRI